MRRIIFGCAFIALASQAVVALAEPDTLPVNKALECNAALPTRAELASLAGKVTLSGEPKASLEMQANLAKPDPSEKIAIAKWATLRDSCFELGTEWMETINAATWFRAIMMEAKDSGDALVSSLYRGELTYGAYNVKQTALLSEIRRRINEGLESTRREASAQPPARTPAAPTAPVERNLAVDRNQCEMDAARAYPVLMQQRMTNPGFQATEPREQQTNCTTFAGQVNCRSTQAGTGASIYNRPPSYVSEDVNNMRRQAAFGSCMEAKGYRRQ